MPGYMVWIIVLSVAFGVTIFFVSRRQQWTILWNPHRTWEPVIEGIFSGILFFLIAWGLFALVIFVKGNLTPTPSPTATPIPTATKTPTSEPTTTPSPPVLNATYSNTDLSVLPVTVVLDGSAVPNSTVILFLDGQRAVTTTASIENTWHAEVQLVTEGLHEVVIRSIDSDGNILGETGKATFTVALPTATSTPVPTATSTPIAEWTAISSQATALAEKDDLLKKQDAQLATAEAQLTALALITPTATMVVVVTETPTPTPVPPTATHTPAPTQAITGPKPVTIHIQGNGINITITGTLKNGN